MTAALIIAAGSGQRMHMSTPKQFLEVDGKPILVHTLERFQKHPMIDAILVVTLAERVEEVRGWADENWNDLAARIVKDGGTILEVGIRRSLAPHSGVIDWTGRRSIQQIARIIENASLFVGIDSVFAHIANATRTRSLVLLGKYRNFPTYFPYSGDFARSSAFRILRPSEGKPVKTLSVDLVYDVVNEMADH